MILGSFFLWRTLVPRCADHSLSGRGEFCPRTFGASGQNQPFTRDLGVDFPFPFCSTNGSFQKLAFIFSGVSGGFNFERCGSLERMELEGSPRVVEELGLGGPEEWTPSIW